MSDQRIFKFDDILLSQLMIKGKKIESVILKIEAPPKNMQKQMGMAVGRDFVAQKINLLKAKPNDSNQIQKNCPIDAEKQVNNESLLLDITQQIYETSGEDKVGESQPNIKCKQSKTSHKLISNNLTKNSTRQNATKKQNKMNNSKLTTPLKLISTHSQKKIAKKPLIQSKTIKNILKNKQCSTIKASKQKFDLVQQQILPIDQVEKIPQMSQMQEMYSEYEVLQQERNCIPVPTPQVNIQTGENYFQQISFQNNQFQTTMPQHPIHYQSSDSQEQDSSDCLGPIRCTTEKDYPLQPYSNTQILSLNSQLFALTAEQLLSKQYFNI